MKAEIVNPSPKFKPVTIQLTFENQDELDWFGSLCNSGIHNDQFPELHKALPDFEFMEKAGADVSRFTGLILSKFK